MKRSLFMPVIFSRKGFGTTKHVSTPKSARSQTSARASGLVIASTRGVGRAVYGHHSKGELCEMERGDFGAHVSPTERTVPNDSERTLASPRFDEKSIQRARPAVPLTLRGRA